MDMVVVNTRYQPGRVYRSRLIIRMTITGGCHCHVSPDQ